jgi:hypothetical protein
VFLGKGNGMASLVKCDWCCDITAFSVGTLCVQCANEVAGIALEHRYLEV